VSACGFLQILALLHHGEAEARSVLERAVDLADAERARLILAKTTDPGRLVRWFSPLVPLCRMAPVVDADLWTPAARRLADLAETVPDSLPLSTVLLGPNTTENLRQLRRQIPFDLVVVSAGELAHDPKLRRRLRGLGICTLAVTVEDTELTPSPMPEAPPLHPVGVT
jgi:hypothetical protein